METEIRVHLRSGNKTCEREKVFEVVGEALKSFTFAAS